MKHRTAIITAASVAVVILAATAAIATNLGILDAATESTEVGALTFDVAEAVPTATPDETPQAQVASEDISAADDQSQSEERESEISAFAVGDAGVVTLSNDGSMLTVTDVVTSPGWETAQILSGTAVDVGFVSAEGVTLQLLAELGDDGAIVTTVNDLTNGSAQVVVETVYEYQEDGSSSSSSSSGDEQTNGDSGTYQDDDEYDDDDTYEDDEDEDEPEDEDDEDEDEPEDEDDEDEPEDDEDD